MGGESRSQVDDAVWDGAAEVPRRGPCFEDGRHCVECSLSGKRSGLMVTASTCRDGDTA